MLTLMGHPVRIQRPCSGLQRNRCLPVCGRRNGDGRLVDASIKTLLVRNETRRLDRIAIAIRRYERSRASPDDSVMSQNRRSSPDSDGTNASRTCRLALVAFFLPFFSAINPVFGRPVRSSRSRTSARESVFRRTRLRGDCREEFGWMTRFLGSGDIAITQVRSAGAVR